MNIQDLTNLRAECEKAISLETEADPGPLSEDEHGSIVVPSSGPGEPFISASFDGGVIIGPRNFAKLQHSYEHSARASRALLLAAEVLERVPTEHIGNALSAIAAEFAGEGAR